MSDFLQKFLICMVVAIVWSMATPALASLFQYSDTLSDSGPGEQSNHTLRMTPTIPLLGLTQLLVLFPPDFELTQATDTFSGVRNVELYVDGVPRVASTTIGPGIDQIAVTRGQGGQVYYTLAPDAVIPPNSQLELRIGNHTSGALGERIISVTPTTTITLPADIEPVRNSNTLGLHRVGFILLDQMLMQLVNTDFLIFINQKVSIRDIDTTEEIPPFRFNPSPTTTVSGLNLNVEISLETDELADCRYDTASGTPYLQQPQRFLNTGQIIHKTNVAVTPNSTQQFFIRCRDDEGNINTDDFEITFAVNSRPSGRSSVDGNGGDGTGTGSSGSGSGSGSGTGTGGSSRSGGGGSGGGSGGGTGSGVGGGFESSDGPFSGGDGQVIISGVALPDATVTIVVDGNAVDTVRTDSQGRYSIDLDEIARGSYTFGIYAEDDNGVRTDTFNTSFTVSGARSSRLSNINLGSTISVTPDPVDIGATTTISGITLPDAVVTIETGKRDSFNIMVSTTTSNGSGAYNFVLDTTGYTADTYQVRVQAVQDNGTQKPFTDYHFFGVGQKANTAVGSDLNGDGKVNLTDFSILLFWWQTGGGTSGADINQDGTVSLTDFSILLFNWTG